jgi:hypothetical protein
MFIFSLEVPTLIFCPSPDSLPRIGKTLSFLPLTGVRIALVSQVGFCRSKPQRRSWFQAAIEVWIGRKAALAKLTPLARHTACRAPVRDAGFFPSFDHSNSNQRASVCVDYFLLVGVGPHSCLLQAPGPCDQLFSSLQEILRQFAAARGVDEHRIAMTMFGE